MMTVKYYEKMYVPVVLRKHKQNIEHYQFIKTITAGSSFAHIVYGGGSYYMCLSKDDELSIEQKFDIPLGFRRDKIEDLEALAKVFDDLYNNENNKPFYSGRRRWHKTVDRPKFDYSLPWIDRMAGRSIINTITGKEVKLDQPRTVVMQQAGLSSHLLNCVVGEGTEIRNWCYKGKRLDGQTWEEYIKNRDENEANKINTNQYSKISFRKGHIVFYYKALRETSVNVGVSYETLRKALIAKENNINGFQIIYSS